MGTLNKNERVKRKKQFLFTLQKGLCIHCKQLMETENVNSKRYYSFEHVVPKSQCNKDFFNMVLACRHCNTKRDIKPLHADTWIAARYVILSHIAERIAHQMHHSGNLDWTHGPGSNQRG